MYALSDFVDDVNELEVLKNVLRGNSMSDEDHTIPNVLVDLCGVFKRSSVRDVRDVIVAETSYKYVYHVDPTDGGDRILCCSTSTDVPFDEEFYKKTDDGILSIDLKTGEYQAQKKGRFDGYRLAKSYQSVGDRLKALAFSDDKGGKFLWEFTDDSLIYDANRFPELIEDLFNIDNEMKWA